MKQNSPSFIIYSFCLILRYSFKKGVCIYIYMHIYFNLQSGIHRQHPGKTCLCKFLFQKYLGQNITDTVQTKSYAQSLSQRTYERQFSKPGCWVLKGGLSQQYYHDYGFVGRQDSDGVNRLLISTDQNNLIYLLIKVQQLLLIHNQQVCLQQLSIIYESFIILT